MSDRERIALDALTLSGDIMHEHRRRRLLLNQRWCRVDRADEWREIYALGEAAYALQRFAFDLDAGVALRAS
jgi:hypothetical protein